MKSTKFEAVATHKNELQQKLQISLLFETLSMKKSQAPPPSSSSEHPSSVIGSSKLSKSRSKPNSKPSSPPPRTPTKRSLNLDPKSPSKKSSKKKKAESGQFQRLWRNDDEIVLLEGIIKFKEERGKDPSADVGRYWKEIFHDFIKSLLHMDFELRQVLGKIRRLKKRYKTSLVSMKMDATGHERNVFDLSDKIWGKDVDADQQRTRNKAKADNDNDNSNGNIDGNSNDKDSDIDKQGISCEFIGKSSISMGLNENVVKVGLELCSQDKKAEIEEMWKQLYVEESNLFLRKFELIRRESELIIEAFKSG